MARSVRGARSGIPTGTILGRKGGARGSRGAAQLLNAADVAQQVIAAGGGSTQSTQGLSSISDGQILSNITGGAGMPVGNTLTAILDHVLGTSRGSLVMRGASAW